MDIAHQEFLYKSLICFVKTILGKIQENTNNEDYSLYIAYRTDNPLAVLSDRMKKYYPHEITIVLQHQFDNLLVHDDSFSVNISFNNVIENICVPFAALINVADPQNGFSLSFDQQTSAKIARDQKVDRLSDYSKKSQSAKSAEDLNQNNDNVIVLDKFRKK